MTTADGTVQGMTQIFGTAPRARAFNVVLLAEGFRSSEQAAFNTAAQTFASTFTTTAPFNGLTGSINVFRVNVASEQSGADDPVATGGTGATPRTYFDAAFGASGIRRLLVCNATTALTVAAAQVPEFSVCLVVVNSTVFGGSGGGVATYSMASGTMEIALHELGHTAFGLADEYAYFAGGSETGHDRHPAGEPIEPNVTLNTNRATLKWRWAVAETTPLPTMDHTSCATVDTRPNPFPATTVGAYEGAHYYHCDAYRPQYNCRMRELGNAFCRVCEAVIVARIAPTNPFPNWQEIDRNPATVAIAAAAGNLYQLHKTGRIWRYTGTPLTGWQELDRNPATVALASDGDQLYQLHNTGRIWPVDGS